MTDEKKAELSKALSRHRGARKEIARREGLSIQFVYMVLSGKRNNSRVLTTACSVLVEYEKQEAERHSQQLTLMDEAKNFLDKRSYSVA